MQPISNRLNPFISAGTSNERALNDGNSPIAESTDASPLTNSDSETRGSSGIDEGNTSLTEIAAKPDALITMNPDDFRQKLNSRTLPDGPILVSGDLSLTDDDALAILPAGLTVGGHLFLSNCASLTSLPAGLNVGRGLDLSGCALLTSLLPGLTVGSWLELERCSSLTALPAGLTVGGDLFLNFCISLTSLPEGLTVHGCLSLSLCRSLTSLPSGLAVDGDLILRDCKSLTSLPAGLSVGGSLDLEGCTSLTSLPAGLTVGGRLNLKGWISLASLPAGLTVGENLELAGCTSLTSLPAGLKVGGVLNLEGCTSLTSLPDGLTVGGVLSLRSCTSLRSLPAGLTVRGGLDLGDREWLTSLPEGLTVGESLFLGGCTSLRSLPAGLTVRGDLDLGDGEWLTSLPEGLTVGGNLNLWGCRSLTSLPEGLNVCGGLYFHGCRSLTSLPEGLTVGGDLRLCDCRSLTSLPERLSLGGHLDLSHCTSLTSLPNRITELGARGDGTVRYVHLTGTGLSDALIDRLRRVEAPGMHFLFSRQATAVEEAFTSIDAAISFWKALVEDALSVSLSLEAGEARDLINFLTRLKATAEYKNILARPVVAKRICNVLKKMEDEEFKERASLIIHVGLSTCHDRIISALDELDLMLQVKEAEEGGKREELCALGKSMLMLEKVQKAALVHAGTLTWVDEIEIQLAFQIGLKDRLQLPLSTGNMIFRGCAHVSDEEIQQVGAEIKRIVSDAVVDDYLLTWAPWQKMLRREAFDALEPELQEAPTDLSWECCLSFDNLTEGYLFRGQLYSRDSLRQVYVDRGVDPFTKQVIDLADVTKVVKFSVAPQE